MKISNIPYFDILLLRAGRTEFFKNDGKVSENWRILENDVWKRYREESNTLDPSPKIKTQENPSKDAKVF